MDRATIIFDKNVKNVYISRLLIKMMFSVEYIPQNAFYVDDELSVYFVV